MLRFLQINVGGRAAQALMMRTAEEIGADIILVSEQIYSGEDNEGWFPDSNGRTAVVVTGDVSVQRAGPQEAGFRWVEIDGLRVYSVYWPPSSSSNIEEFKDFLTRLEDSIRDSDLPVIAAGDFNSKSGSWGSPTEDARGALLADLMASIDMTTCNQRNSPTFVRGSSETYIDITFAKSNIIGRIEGWKILEKESLSLHRYITFDIKSSPRRLSGQRAENRWSWRNFSLEKLQQFMSNITMEGIEDAAQGVNELVNITVEACNQSMPKGSYKWGKKPTYWWSKEIEELRRKCHVARRKLKRKRRREPHEQNRVEYEVYKEARKALKIGIENSKKGCWDKLCKQVDADPWGLPFKIVMKKLVGRRPIPEITLPGRMEHIVDTLFPKAALTIWPATVKGSTFPEVTCEEILNCVRKTPSGKAPGPDGIPDMVIREIARSRPDVVSKVFTMCFRDGYFPSEWKLAKLVLLRKANKPLEQPSSYRPICLLNTTGKFFERLIKCRLEKHLEEYGGLSDRQFGFRKGKSTVDAIARVMELVESVSSGPLRKREICALVTLDVANAFNSADWTRISEALVRRHVPKYLVQIIHSYLSERILVYGKDARRDVVAGVPQGSVIGPALWNVMYDDLLRIDLGEKVMEYSPATLIAFADDIAVVATGRTTQALEETTNRALAAVAGWMEQNGLTLAAHKTEAVILTTKRGYEKPSFTLNGATVEPKEQLKYLGVEISRRLGFRHHIKRAAVKAGATAEALSRIMPNVRGPGPRARKLLATVVNNQLLYAAPIWAGALMFDCNIGVLEGPQRKIALRTAMAYRTVSTQAILVVAGMLPAHLLANERQRNYKRMRKGEPGDDVAERERSFDIWQEEWGITTKGRWTWRLVKDVRQWTKRKHGECNFHLTQMLTGHGCFGHYLHRFKKRLDPRCVDCGAAVDDAEHTIFRCDRWWWQRRVLEVQTGADMEPETIVGSMLRCRDNWNAVNAFVYKVLSTKEEEERAVQRAAEQAARNITD